MKPWFSIEESGSCVCCWGRRLQEEEGEAIAEAGYTCRKGLWKLSPKTFLTLFMFLYIHHWGGSTCISLVSSVTGLLETDLTCEFFKP